MDLHGIIRKSERRSKIIAATSATAACCSPQNAVNMGLFSNRASGIHL
jgi:hypothetical protein